MAKALTKNFRAVWAQERRRERQAATPSASLLTASPTVPVATLKIGLSEALHGIEADSVSGADVKVYLNSVLLEEDLDYALSYDPANQALWLTALPLLSNFPAGEYEIVLNPGV